MWWLGLLNRHQLPTAELRYDQSLSHSVDQHNHEGQGKGLQGKGQQEKDEVDPDEVEGETWRKPCQRPPTNCQVLQRLE